MSLRTLLIDADLRMPTIGKVLPGTDRGGGLAEVLLGRIELEEAVTETGQKNLFVLPAGRMRQSPAEVLAATTFLDLLSLARQDFERIVIDTPPVQSVSDALLLAKYVQLTVLVVKAGKVPRRAVQNAVQRLAEAGPLSTIKIILNGVPANGRHHYHYGAGKYGEAVYTPAREGTLV